MSGTAYEHGIGIAFSDNPAEVGIDEVEAGARTPMADQSRLRVFRSEGLADQSIVEQVDLSNGQIVGRSPVDIQSRQLSITSAI
jgi:hypothetical protein